ncbi:GNAT family N-acetyltransferase [Marinobacter zhejiangensis]|uniref:Acetyltransferase involved in cellulose biosynthesis, CelD/BcsL family n=1 Tax=Marinobacter zhejiangensis TaxID=488535 RepID=A0A1I4RP45_9GAMM|nr:GNAT family N-acetyltransferase [Marinobacter zhejiangensis]SFM54018.1 Acetyltransferase involved in cellulose biosynthesis, CelD/BcsL family [Marinobacter zhejiangensis]
MKLKVIRTEEAFDRIQPQWDELLAKLDPVPLTLTHAWLRSWLGAFSAGMQVEFRCVYQGDALVGVAPFVKVRERYRGVPVTLLKLAANGHTPYSSIVVDSSLSAGDQDQALGILTKIAPDEIGLFFKINQKSGLRDYLLDRSKIGHGRVGQKPGLRTPVVDIDRSWDEFYRSRRRSLKKSLNHKLNRFNKSGEFTITEEPVTRADQPIIDELVTISAKSWKSTIGNDLKSNQRSRQFLLNLAETFGHSGNLTAWIVRHRDTTPVAFELHLAYDHIAYPIRADYDEAFNAYSPGSVLEFSALRSLFESGACKQYYTCADDYWYLSKWTEDYEDICSVELFGSSLKLRLLYLAEYRVIPVIKRFIKKDAKQAKPA